MWASFPAADTVKLRLYEVPGITEAGPLATVVTLIRLNVFW